MTKAQRTAEQKRLDADIWIIALVTFGVFLCYAAMGESLMRYASDSGIPVLPRLLLSAGIQFGVAGLGITVVCILRREKFALFGLTKRNAGKAVLGTVICFLPLILEILASGQFDGYRPFSRIMITDDVLASGFPFSVFGMALIVLSWGFFEGFNYAVISEKINQRYPSGNPWLDYGAISCAAVCILFHPISISFWGIVEIIATFLAIYGMLIVKRKTGNAWGCIFAFCFIWNAL